MKNFLFAILLLSFSLTSTAQTYGVNQSNEGSTQANTSVGGFDKTKLTFGGGLGLQFGSHTLVNISPQVGYDLSSKFNVGAGIGYSYSDHDSKFSNFDETRHTLGLNVYGRFYPIKNIILMLQPEINHVWQTRGKGSSKFSSTDLAPAVLVGAGVRLGRFTAMLQYDFLGMSYSPYEDSIFYSVGYTFGR